MVSALSLSRLFDGFLLAKEAAGVRDTTLEMYRTAYHSLVATLPDEVVADVRLITSEHLLAWAAAAKRYATATRDQRISKLKTLFHWAHQEGYVDRNPTTVLVRPRKDWRTAMSNGRDPPSDSTGPMAVNAGGSPCPLLSVLFEDLGHRIWLDRHIV